MEAPRTTMSRFHCVMACMLKLVVIVSFEFWGRGGHPTFLEHVVPSLGYFEIKRASFQRLVWAEARLIGGGGKRKVSKMAWSIFDSSRHLYDRLKQG